MKEKDKELLNDLTESVSQVVEKVKMWKGKNFKLDQLPDMVKHQLEKISEILPTFDDDSDFQKAFPVYLNIAKFLKDRFKKDFLICLGSAFFLCHEKEVKELAASSKEEILVIKVHHTRAEPCSCETEIFFKKDGKPTSYSVKEFVSRDDLISDVREEFMKSDKEKVSIKLYPAEG